MFRWCHFTGVVGLGLFPGDSRCHISPQKVTLMIFFCFCLSDFSPPDMLETQFHVMLGNIKWDWLILAGFPLLCYWRKASFPKGRPSTRQAREWEISVNKAPWWDDNYYLSWLWFILAFLKILTHSLHCLALGKHGSPPIEWEGWQSALRLFPLLLHLIYLRLKADLAADSPLEIHCEWPRCVAFKRGELYIISTSAELHRL